MKVCLWCWGAFSLLLLFLFRGVLFPLFLAGGFPFALYKHQAIVSILWTRSSSFRRYQIRKRNRPFFFPRPAPSWEGRNRISRASKPPAAMLFSFFFFSFCFPPLLADLLKKNRVAARVFPPPPPFISSFFLSGGRGGLTSARYSPPPFSPSLGPLFFPPASDKRRSFSFFPLAFSPPSFRQRRWGSDERVATMLPFFVSPPSFTHRRSDRDAWNGGLAFFFFFFSPEASCVRERKVRFISQLFSPSSFPRGEKLRDRFASGLSFFFLFPFEASLRTMRGADDRRDQRFLFPFVFLFPDRGLEQPVPPFSFKVFFSTRMVNWGTETHYFSSGMFSPSPL